MNKAMAIARKFHSIIRENLAENLEEIDRRNLEEEHTCATQDFCDANVYMNEAFEAVMEREHAMFVDGSPEADKAKDNVLWNTAWAMAVGHGFSKEW